jgi:hypothetical protein
MKPSPLHLAIGILAETFQDLGAAVCEASGHGYLSILEIWTFECHIAILFFSGFYSDWQT